jgi:hypothetical protein
MKDEKSEFGPGGAPRHSWPEISQVSHAQASLQIVA